MPRPRDDSREGAISVDALLMMRYSTRDRMGAAVTIAAVVLAVAFTVLALRLTT